MVYRFLVVKEVEKDIRSDSDEETETKKASSSRRTKPAKQD